MLKHFVGVGDVCSQCTELGYGFKPFSLHPASVKRFQRLDVGADSKVKKSTLGINTENKITMS